MANVVGILVVLLAVTQINVGDAVDRIQMEDPNSKNRHQSTTVALNREIERLATAIEDTNALLQTTSRNAVTDADLERLETKANLLDNARNDTHSDKLEDLQMTARIDAFKRDIRTRKSQIRNLQSQLKQAQEKLKPVNTQQPPKTVRLPNPRSAPSHASPVIFLCRYGRLSHLNVQKLNQELEHGIEMAIGISHDDLVLTPRHLRIIDHYFTDHFVGDDNFRLVMRVAGDGLVVELQWVDTSAGESTEDLHRPDSIFRTIINSIDRDRQFISFNVWSDSFETYLEARQIGDDHKVAAGWITFDRDDEYRSRLFTRSTHRPEYIVD